MDLKLGQPAVDGKVVSPIGSTRDGQPLSFNRAPAPDIAPWIARLYATELHLPEGYRLDCGLIYDLTMFRLQLGGDWTAQTADGPRELGRSALMFGPQTRRMLVSVKGSFVSVGFALRPGTGHALLGFKTRDFLDRFVLCDEIGLPGEAALDRLSQFSTPEEWLTVLEDFIRRLAAGMGGAHPDPVTADFEMAALIDPTFNVGDYAREQGIPQRRLERIILRDFGLSPKQVLRRSRALDMAAHLRGVGDHAEAEEVALRYYDQSHLIREFIALFGMTPRQFVETPQPLLTLALESRQARRLEAIDRLAPGAGRPWQ